ncbi:hypothetical protein BALOs_2689 [Halobacteriovorax sp. BALOs_7]|nr:hypothetical protein BALOs_2689 [Halobacteriovorax sp. BALOs_7]
MEFCFKKGPSIHATRLKIKEYLIEGESIKILPKSHCLDVKVKPTRQIFISKIIKSHFRSDIEVNTIPIFNSEFCKFKLKEETTIEDKVSESISELISMNGDEFDLDLSGTQLSMICHKKAGSYSLDLISKNTRKDLLNIKLETGKWFDLSTLSSLEGKKFSLMVIE